jgi:hypothetical protein
MIAIVSSISRLLCASRGASLSPQPLSNVCATDEAAVVLALESRLLLCSLMVALLGLPAVVEAQQSDPRQGVNETAAVGGFLAGAVVGLVAHEGGHLLFNVIFDADPGFKRIEFHGIPFFAVTHRPDLSPRQEFVVSSAGFWVQHATNEWILTRQPRLRTDRSPFVKGMFAFNVSASAAYSAVAFSRSGPDERDTRGMAVSSRVDERWIGALILAPAVLDSWRYLAPDAKWPIWLSRAAKIGAVLLVLR